jgi:hypothetical protein
MALPKDVTMLGREFVKRIRLLMGRTETVKTRFDLNKDGTLVEHVALETHDAPGNSPKAEQPQSPGTSHSSHARGPTHV